MTFCYNFYIYSLILCVLFIGYDCQIIKSPPLGDVVKGFGYPYENHTVTTEDGWILTTGRIPFHQKKGNCSQKRGTILLSHGILNNAAVFVFLGPHKSIGLILADQCYDVWLANARGTRYTKHKKYSKNEKEFWNFGFDDLAMYDTAALIKYITHTTGEHKIHYFGYSQGTSQILALLSHVPEYQKSISSVHLAAPIAFLTNVKSYPQWLPRAVITELLQNVPELIYRPAPDHEGIVRDAVFDSCWRSKEKPRVFCEILAIFSGGDKVFQEKWATHFPDLLSLKTMGQFAQQQLDDDFQMYNYGPVKNAEVYGTKKQPSYPLDRLQTPVYIYNALEDKYSTPSDVERLVRRLPNVRQHHFINTTDFGHTDFVKFTSITTQQFHQHFFDALNNRS